MPFVKTSIHVEVGELLADHYISLCGISVAKVGARIACLSEKAFRVNITARTTGYGNSGGTWRVESIYNTGKWGATANALRVQRPTSHANTPLDVSSRLHSICQPLQPVTVQHHLANNVINSI